jgi:hypothetical protein
MTAYTDFVKKHFHDKKHQGHSPQEIMKALAAEYRKQNPKKEEAAKPRVRRQRKGAAGQVSAGGIGSDIGTAVDAIGSLFGLGLERKKGGAVSAGAMSAGRMRKKGGAVSAGAMSAGRMRRKGGAVSAGAITAGSMRRKGGAISDDEMDDASSDSAGAVSAGRMRRGKVHGSGAISSALASLLPF